MKFALTFALFFVCTAASVWAQFSALTAQPSAEEQAALSAAITAGSTSPMDMVRALEAHLEKFPTSTQRGEIELNIARAAIEAKDTPRIVKYGPKAIDVLPEDVLILDRVAAALITTGGRDNADQAYLYARRIENMVDKLAVPEGPDAARLQEERDRALGRVLLYQSRARTLTREPEEAIRLASRSFDVYPSEESAREWAQALYTAGRVADAILRLADAFTVPDARATEQTRLDDRILLGEWFRKMHGNETGLGDLMLAAYDRTSVKVETRRKKMLALDPNAAQKNPFEFTLTSLDGQRFRLSSLKGNVVVLDFWATWCVPCRAQHPLYEQLKEKFPRDKGVVFLSVNADEDHSLIDPFLEEMMWSKDVYHEDGLARLMSVTIIPSTIVFDRQGNLASRMDGFNPETFIPLMAARLEDLLANK